MNDTERVEETTQDPGKPGLLAERTAAQVIVSRPPGEAANSGRDSFGERYAKYEGIADELAEDFALNHDHYLHGAFQRT
jgi:hypothetical protein